MKAWRLLAGLLILSLCPWELRASLDRSSAGYLLKNASFQVIRSIEEGFPLLPKEQPPALDDYSWDGIVLRFHFEGRRSIRAQGEGPDIHTAYCNAVRSLADRGAKLARELREKNYRSSLSLYKKLKPFRARRSLLSERWSFGHQGLVLVGEKGKKLICPMDYLAQGLSPKKILKAQSVEYCIPLKVQSWVCSTKSKTAVPFEKGGLRFDGITKRRLIKATLMAGYYLVKGQDEQGRFLYEYCPCRGKEVPGYNMVRHAGVIWALLRLYRASGKRRILLSALKGIRYLVKSLEREGSKLFLGKDNRSVLGGTALSIVALTSLPKENFSEKLQKITKAMGRGLVSLQHPSGAFYLSLQGRDQNELPNRPPPFYPGESLLALSGLWKRFGDGIFSTAARKAAKQQMNLFRKRKVVCHWSVQALVAVAKLLDSRPTLALAGEMAKELVAEQNKDSSSPYHPGSWPTKMGITTACSAACRLEALGPAIEALRHLQDPVEELETTMMRAAAFILSQQFDKENSFLLKSSRESLGGVKKTPMDYSIRMDVNQHVISALLNTLELLEQNPSLAAAWKKPRS